MIAFSTEKKYPFQQKNPQKGTRYLIDRNKRKISF
jgi:hypothetical protein